MAVLNFDDIPEQRIAPDKKSKSGVISFDDIPTATLTEDTGGVVNALLYGFATPVQAIGKTARALGAETIGKALEATPTPKGYASRGERFINPREGDLNIGGFGVGSLPLAAVEQAGQLAGSLLSRGAGVVIGGALGGPGGAIVGGSTFYVNVTSNDPNAVVDALRVYQKRNGLAVFA